MQQRLLLHLTAVVLRGAAHDSCCCCALLHVSKNIARSLLRILEIVDSFLLSLVSLAHFAMCETTTTGTPTLSAEGRKVWGVAGGRAGGCGVVLTP